MSQQIYIDYCNLKMAPLATSRGHNSGLESFDYVC